MAGGCILPTTGSTSETSIASEGGSDDPILTCRTRANLLRRCNHHGVKRVKPAEILQPIRTDPVLPWLVAGGASMLLAIFISG